MPEACPHCPSAIYKTSVKRSTTKIFPIKKPPSTLVHGSGEDEEAEIVYNLLAPVQAKRSRLLP